VVLEKKFLKMFSSSWPYPINGDNEYNRIDSAVCQELGCKFEPL
jgi:hypothetical protein